MYSEIKDSVLWKYAEEQMSVMPLREKILLYSRTFYPKRNHTLSIEEKIDILMKIPDKERLLMEILTGKQMAVLLRVDAGMKYEDICKELGYANKSSITQTLNAIKREIEKKI